VDGVENLRPRRISGFHRLLSCCWLEAKKNRRIHDSNAQSSHGQRQLTRVNSTNVQDEGLRIGGRGRQMNSKVKISQTRRVSRINVVINCCVHHLMQRRGLCSISKKKSRINVVLNLAQSQSVPGRPLLAPIYRWPGLKDPVRFNTNYSIHIRY
jgi:hypothetical protein